MPSVVAYNGTLPEFGVRHRAQPLDVGRYGYIESFNVKMRDEFLNCEMIDTLHEAEVLAEKWRIHYNCFRPHSSRNYLPPAPQSYEFWELLCRTA